MSVRILFITIVAWLSPLIPMISAWATQENTSSHFSHELDHKQVVERYLPIMIANKLKNNYSFAVDVILNNTMSLSSLNSKISLIITAVNWDGSVVIGQTQPMSGSISNSTARAFILTKDHELKYLNEIQDKEYSRASAMNWDGTIVVGDIIDVDHKVPDSDMPINSAFVWTSTKGMRLLDNDGSIFSSADDISDDGSVIVGSIRDKKNVSKSLPCMWTESAGLELLNTLDNDNNYNYIQAVSGNGKVIIGHSHPGNNHDIDRAFIWTKEKGAWFPDTLNITKDVRVTAVNWDGSVIVGSFYQDGKKNYDCRAFIWTEKDGIRRLTNDNRKHLSWADSVSHDGKRVVGLISKYKNIKGKRVDYKEKVIWQIMPDGQIKIYSLKKTLQDKYGFTYDHGYGVDSCMNILGNIIIGKYSYVHGPHNEEMFSPWIAHIPRIDYLSEQYKIMDRNLIEYKW